MGSEQELLDCDHTSHGCNGGWTYKAFDFIRDKGGLDTEESYPYEGVEHQYCSFSKKNVGATDRGHIWIESGNEEDLKYAVATKGPVSVSINADDSKFQRWQKNFGIYDGPCSISPNHAVLIVGYGEEEYRPYWLVKNSWSTSWGDNGYIKMARNVNICGIASAPVLPLV